MWKSEKNLGARVRTPRVMITHLIGKDGERAGENGERPKEEWETPRPGRDRRPSYSASLSPDEFLYYASTTATYEVPAAGLIDLSPWTRRSSESLSRVKDVVKGIVCSCRQTKAVRGPISRPFRRPYELIS